MKEWLVVDPAHEDEWEALAREAMEYGAAVEPAIGRFKPRLNTAATKSACAD